ncbi:hypothetical protein TNCT_606441 [Trichonephila clavata]|uniref:Uncharacterized protein n=1 Tax=Trichonephila clavata TaxID=2740835 RepID=A0A8X6I0G8_TRICU|nr:hypothetical protein TNCT_606441 [Trichonephila clavata]
MIRSTKRNDQSEKLIPTPFHSPFPHVKIKSNPFLFVKEPFIKRDKTVVCAVLNQMHFQRFVIPSSISRGSSDAFYSDTAFSFRTIKPVSNERALFTTPNKLLNESAIPVAHRRKATSGGSVGKLLPQHK